MLHKVEQLDNLTDQEVLVDLLLRWEEAQEKGQSLSPEELCKDKPHLLATFNERLQLLKKVDWINAGLDIPRNNDQGKTHSCIIDPETMTTHPFWGRYRIEEFVGKGSYGEIWKAWDPELNRPVAIKIPQQRSRKAHQHFIEEARRIARLNHPGIVRIYDVGVDHDAVYLVCEFIEGKALDQVSFVRGDVSVVLHCSLNIALIADALQHAHELGVIHGDIKESNILIDAQGTPRLTDFGISNGGEVIEEGDTLGHMIRGTPIYMAPELLQGRESQHTVRTDIYSLGVVLYRTLTGQFPHEFKTLFYFMTDRKPILPLRKTNPAVSSRLEQACLKALCPSPQERYASAKEFAEALRRCSSSHRSRIGPVAVAIFSIVALILAVQVKSFIGAEALPTQVTIKDRQKAISVESKTPINVFTFQKLEGHQDLISSLHFLNDATLLSAGYDKRVLLWDVVAGKVIREIPGLINEGGFTLQFNKSKSKMYVGSVVENSESEVREYDFPAGTRLRTLPFGAREERLRLAISPDDRFLAAVGSSTFSVWNLETGERTLQITEKGQPRGIVLSDDHRLFVGYIQDALKIYDVTSGTLLESVPGPFSIRCMTHIGNAKEYVGVGNFGYWTLFNMGTTPILQTKIQPKDIGDRQFQVVGLSSDRMLIGYQSGVIRLWDIRSLSVRCSFHGHITTVHSLAVSPDEKQFASGDDQGNLYLWKILSEDTGKTHLPSQ